MLWVDWLSVVYSGGVIVLCDILIVFWCGEFIVLFGFLGVGKLILFCSFN